MFAEKRKLSPDFQGGEARSRSAGVRSRGGSSTGERRRAGVGRTSSLRRGERGVARGGSFKDENAAGPVSVHVKQVLFL